MANDIDSTTAKAEINALIADYIQAVRGNDLEALRATFDPAANIAHYYVKGDAVKTIDVDTFLGTITSLHQKFDNAEERAYEVDIKMVGPLAAVRVPFGFVMGPKTLEGEDIFNLARVGGKWKIIHKSYWL